MSATVMRISLKLWPLLLERLATPMTLALVGFQSLYAVNGRSHGSG
jgi:hypothetical protein